jgi:hypothetical protein
MRPAGEQEAVAAIAAIERFLAETAPAAAEEGEDKEVSPWQRAALIEGVSVKGTVADLEREDSWLS